MKGKGENMVSADKVISVAMNEVGYLEKASNANLDSKTGNAGTKNFTKYARDYAKFAGTNLQGQAWCDMFVDWCFVQAFGILKAKELLGGFNAYTPTSAQYFKNMGHWYSTPTVGDVIFFKNSSRICHTGIVYKVTGENVYTIEGNTSGTSGVIANGGGVCTKVYDLNNSRIAGYGRPAYENTVTNSSPSIPTRNYLQKGDIGSSVKTMQTMLIKCGFSCGSSGADGQFGDATEKAVKDFQKKYVLAVDGQYGVNSKAKLELLYSEVNKTPSTPSANTVIKNGQIHANNFCGTKIVTDGMFGSETKKAAVKVLQTAMNLDYKSNLVVDGIWGNKSESALRGHYVKHGETQYMVTALQILLMLRGYDPNGVECPGTFGNGCKTAVHKYKADNKLSNNDIADYNAFKKLIS